VRINCHVPITVRIVGVPTTDDLAAVGEAVARAVRGRLDEAERVLADRYCEADQAAPRERYDARRSSDDGYAVPSYGDDGRPVVVPVAGAGGPAGGTAGRTMPAGTGIQREAILADGTTVIDIIVGPTAARLGFEDTLPTGTEVGLSGWQRAHASGAVLGGESDKGIRYVPPEVNLKYQNAGIERFVRELYDERDTDVVLHLRTETESHPMSLRLARITYQLSASRGGGDPQRLMEVTINVANTRTNPRIWLDEPIVLGDWAAFLRPVAPRATSRGGSPSPAPVEPTPPGGQTPSGRSGAASTAAQAVAGLLASDLFGAINFNIGLYTQARDSWQAVIDWGEASLSFWAWYGARPERGVWDPVEKVAYPGGTLVGVDMLGSTRYPYVVTIDTDAFRDHLGSTIHTYQDFTVFLDLAVGLGVIVREPSAAGRAMALWDQTARYVTIVSRPDPARRRVIDLTGTIGALRSAALASLQALSVPATGAVFRLRGGAGTRIYRSRGGRINDQPIHNSRQEFGPDPWVRVVIQAATGDRVLVEPSNVDAQRAAMFSRYLVRLPIQEAFDEVVQGGRPILFRGPAQGPLHRFVAGPDPAGRRFGTTRYDADPESGYTLATGELKQFWVDRADLTPVRPDAAEWAK
jgi:hypothetical protein